MLQFNHANIGDVKIKNMNAIEKKIPEKLKNRTLGFRPKQQDEDMASEIERAAVMLGESTSEIVREAVRLGLKPALQKIAEQKRQNARDLLKKFGRNRISFNLAGGQDLSALFAV